MKGKQLFASALCVLALVACNKRPEEAVTTTETPTTAQATTVAETTVQEVQETYFEQLHLAYNLVAKDADAQSGLQAAHEESQKLIAAHPSDKAMIEKHYKDLERLVQHNSTGFAKFMQEWNQRRDQHYEPLQEALDLTAAKVNGEATSWNMMGKVTANDYQILIVDAYIDNTNQQAYLFGYKGDEPIFLQARSVSRDTLKDANFEEVENADLRAGFLNNVTWKKEAPQSNPSIADVMAVYARKKGEVYERTSPATQRLFYDLAVPDQLFQYATVAGMKAKFTWGELTFKQGDVPYEIVECYVSESGTTVIVFAKVGNGKVILIGQTAPETVKNADGTIKSSTVNLQPYNSETLSRATW